MLKYNFKKGSKKIVSKTPANWHPAQYHIDEFFEAIEDNNIKRVEELLKLFPNDIVNISDADNNTALHLAAKRGDLAMTKLLVNNGANLYAKNLEGRTAFQEAEKNQRTTAGYLLGYPDTKLVQNYLKQMDASLKTFLKIAQGFSSDRLERIESMRKKAPWMLNAKTQDGIVVKDIILETKTKRKISKNKADVAKKYVDLKHEIAALEIARAAEIERIAEDREKKRKAAAGIGSLKMEAAEIRRKAALEKIATKPAEMKRKLEEKIAQAKAREEEKIKRGFDALLSNDAIDLKRTKDRIRTDQDKVRAENERRELEQAKSEFAEEVREITKKREEQQIQKNISSVRNSELFLKGEKKLQEKFKKITSFLRRNPQFSSIIDEMSGIREQKSRTSAKIARVLLGRKTDKDMLKEAIAQLKEAVSTKDKDFEVKKIDRWKKSKNQGSRTT